MIDLWTVLYIASTAILWRMGGRSWGNKFGAWVGKDWRRSVAPILTILFLIYVGNVAWYVSLLTGILQKVSLHMGYGDKSPLWKKLLTLIGIGMPALVLGVWIGPLITLIQFGGWYLMSRMSNKVNWSLAEFQAGASQAGSIAIGIF